VTDATDRSLVANPRHDSLMPDSTSNGASDRPELERGLLLWRPYSAPMRPTSGRFSPREHPTPPSICCFLNMYSRGDDGKGLTVPDSFGKRNREKIKARKAEEKDERRVARNQRRKGILPPTPIDPVEGIDPTPGEPIDPIVQPVPGDQIH
jgi:hypothetical protein